MYSKNSRIVFPTFFLTVILLIVGCSWDYYEAIERPEDVSFSNQIIPIFNADCNMSGCHATGAITPDLSPQNAFSALMDAGMIDTDNPTESTLYKRMNSSTDPMPTSGKLPELTVITVLVWIEEGAQNN